jgi:hypothetical protein
MTQKQNIRLTLVFGLFFISLGGWLLHTRAHHPFTGAFTYDVPFIIGLLNFIVVPWLFLYDRSIALGYLINGFTVIFGIIFMAHFSVIHHPKEIVLKAVLLMTVVPDIIILFTKFMVGKALFDLHLSQLDKEIPLKVKPLRYPNLGWWIVHFVAISVVYSIGAIFL